MLLVRARKCPAFERVFLVCPLQRGRVSTESRGVGLSPVRVRILQRKPGSLVLHRLRGRDILSVRCVTRRQLVPLLFRGNRCPLASFQLLHQLFAGNVSTFDGASLLHPVFRGVRFLRERCHRRLPQLFARAGATFDGTKRLLGLCCGHVCPLERSNGLPRLPVRTGGNFDGTKLLHLVCRGTDTSGERSHDLRQLSGREIRAIRGPHVVRELRRGKIQPDPGSKCLHRLCAREVPVPPRTKCLLNSSTRRLYRHPRVHGAHTVPREYVPKPARVFDVHYVFGGDDE